MDDSIRIAYHEDLKPLEDLLAGVRRAGDFFASGTIEVPMPRVEIDGAGVLSFPVPREQAAALIAQAVRAPYGRGAETIVDTAVRNVWQVPAERVAIGGKSWAKTFKSILDAATHGLGCGEAAVSAEFYKLLVYDEGGFFLSHRDTEKADGMFGTLVIVLPCAHGGGELLIRHAGRETSVDLSAADFSELSYAAFYADCEHEVRPITEGRRVCLIYNLIHEKAEPLGAPLHDAEVAAAAGMIAAALEGGGAPAKIVWLLEHQYSPAGLSFSELKNADAARAQVLVQAAARAGCAAHLGIVHIEESGPAEISYESYSRGRRWRQDDDDDEEEDEDFEVIEVSESWQYIDQWRDTEDRVADFGKVPLSDGEVLPSGALDGEEPDEQRVMEATGNEGASFERSYHRAAVVLWARERFADVLLQGGVGAVLPFFEGLVAAAQTESGCAETRSLAGRIIAEWKGESSILRPPDPRARRDTMLALLNQLGDGGLLRRFISEVVAEHYDGSENAALQAAPAVLGAAATREVFCTLVDRNLRELPNSVVRLVAGAIAAHKGAMTAAWCSEWCAVAGSVIAELPQIGKARPHSSFGAWWREEDNEPVAPALVVDLLAALALLDSPPLREAATETFAAHPQVFDPGKVIVPALASLREHDSAFRALWKSAAQFLLARSENRIEPPRDWRQEASLSCQCPDCRELQRFAADADAQSHRFRIRQDRRRHLHEMIAKHDLDMTHATERQGSPQTLVCTKTRRHHLRRVRQHAEDRAALRALLTVFHPARGDGAALAARMSAAIAGGEA